MRKNLRKWLLGVIAAVSLAVTACQGADVASGAGAAADIAQAAGNILGDLAESKASGAGVISQEKAIPAHRKRAEVPEPSSYRIFRNIPDHRMLRSMEMFRIFRRAISRMSPLRATVTSMRWDDAAWHTLR